MAQRLWILRCLVGIVLFFNVQCAVVFLLDPGAYAPAFELSGAAGRAMVQGLGILFLMWNIPYAFAVVHPIQNRTSLLEASAMQAIGLVGESLLYGSLSPGFSILKSTTARFILFDGSGLLLLLAAVWLVFRWERRGKILL